MKYPLVLVGMPGSGKSTLGQALSGLLKLPFADFDALLEQQEGKSIPQIFAEEGESYFRDRESALLKKTLLAAPQMVLATGGGAPCFFNNMAFIKQHAQSIYLQVDWPLLARRLAQQPGQRPLLQGVSEERYVESLVERFGWRIPYYTQADVVLTVGEQHTPQELAARVLQQLQ